MTEHLTFAEEKRKRRATYERITALEADNATLRELLREVVNEHPCHICGGWGLNVDDHSTDCRLGQLLINKEPI